MESKPPSLPFLHLPFTDFLLLLNPSSIQDAPKTLCARIERRLAGCFEAYGYGKRGKERCKDLFYDYHECWHSSLQLLRHEAIRKERMKQYREGKLERPFDEHPPIDGLLYYNLV